MSITIPTSNGEILYSPNLPREVLKESLKILLDKSRLRQYFIIGVVADTLYPKLYHRFRQIYLSGQVGMILATPILVRQ